jgi:branched-chain amino acid transport system permease protein
MARFWTVRVLSILVVIALAWVVGTYIDTQMLTGSAASWRRVIYLCGFYSILAVSLNIINGITGQFSIGHAAFYQVGAFAAGYFSMVVLAGRIGNEAALLIVVTVIGGVFAAGAGWMIGMPTLRLRGDYLAIATLGFGEIVRIVLLNQQWLGGSFGLSVTPAHDGTALLLDGKLMFYILLVLALTIAVSRNLLKTVHGLAFLSVREDEVAADAMGVNTTRYKIWAFVIGASLAGAAGSLLAHTEGFISPDTFKMEISFIVLTMVVVGGTGSITGSLFAAIGLILLQERLNYLPAVTGGHLLLSGLLLIVGSLIASSYCRRHAPPAWQSVVIWTGTVAVCVVAGTLIGGWLATIPALAPALAKSYEAYQLRLVLFSLALVVIMLVRPQGIFGHHEICWRLLSRSFSPIMRRPFQT